MTYGSMVMPIYQTSTFIFDNCAQGGNRFAGDEGGHIYTRISNPTSSVLENRLAILENAEAAVACSSGMGSITAVLWTLCSAGTHILADTTLYGCTHEFLADNITRFGVEVTFVDMTNLDELKKALRKNTVAVYFETPANPDLKIIDIEGVAKISHEYNPEIRVIIDNTFSTPYLTKPLDLGCDVVVHSATKYLNGHGDVIAGFACGTAEFMEAVRLVGVKDMTGSVIGPFESYLIMRGMKTLEIRMDRHCQNAQKIAEYLDKHPKISKVFYPGLPNHPGHEIAKKQMKQFGGMVSFEVKGGKEAAVKLLNNLKVCLLAVSLGATETLIEHPASMTHSTTYTPEALAEAHLTEGLVRLSVGLECADDLIADFDQSFKNI